MPPAASDASGANTGLKGKTVCDGRIRKGKRVYTMTDHLRGNETHRKQCIMTQGNALALHRQNTPNNSLQDCLVIFRERRADVPVRG